AEIEHEVGGEEHADHRADAAKNADSAEENDGDDVELEALRGAGPHGAETGGHQHSGHGGDESAQHEDADLRPGDGHAGESRDLGAVTDDIGEPPEPAEMED